MVSAVILALGLLAVLAILFSGDRRRERAASQVLPGDDSTLVVQRLGPPPVRCPVGTLAHLNDRFQGGTPRVTRESTLAWMRRETTARWIYPDDADERGCTPAQGAAEIGLGRQGQVVWTVPVHGRKTLVLPDTI